MARFLRTSLRRSAHLALATSLVLACGQRAKTRGPTVAAPSIAKTTSALSTGSITGASLANDDYVLTFDDGPSAVTAELSTWLNARPTAIRATFFVDGACVGATALTPNDSPCATPTDNATAILTQLANDGHFVANHTTTARDLVNEVPAGERVQEVTETDAWVAAHTAWNRLFFRAPDGAWDTGAGSAHESLAGSAMNKYIGPIGWDIGGGPTDQTPAATMAADRECWQLGYTSRECGDRYVAEARAKAKGILLFHDGAGNLANHDLDNGTGNTVDMVKYVVAALETGGATFRALDAVPAIASLLPSCHASCATCNGPGANACTSCPAGRFVAAGVCTPCSTCGAGTFRAAACSGATDTLCSPCTACADGTFQSAACTATSDTVCTACDASCSTCSGAGSTACTSCPERNYLSAGRCSACAVCGAGYYQSTACTTTTNTVCGACHATCTACAGPDISQCGSCPPNFFVNGPVCTECKSCEAGEFQSAACGLNTNTVCVLCPRGTSSNDGALACVACEPGTFAASPGSSRCAACPSCDDSDPCTRDTCEVTGGCIHEPIAGCGQNASSSSGTSSSGIVEAPSLNDPKDVGGGTGDDSGCALAAKTAHRAPTNGASIASVVVAAALAMLRRRRRRQSPYLRINL